MNVFNSEYDIVKRVARRQHWSVQLSTVYKRDAQQLGKEEPRLNVKELLPQHGHENGSDRH